MSAEAQDLFARGADLMRAGDLSGAEAVMAACAAADPAHVDAHLNLGLLRKHRGDLAAAVPPLEQAAALKPTKETLSALAGVRLDIKQYRAAEALYLRLLEALPEDIPALKALATIREHKGDRAGARHYHGRVHKADPSDINAGISYATATWRDDPAVCVAVLEELMAYADNDAKRILVLKDLVIHKEWHERIKRGLMPYHVSRLDELFFTFAAAEAAQLRDVTYRAAAAFPDNNAVQIAKFYMAFTSNDRPAMHACLTRTPDAGGIWPAVTFDAADYRRLDAMSDADIIADLPPLVDVKPCAGGTGAMIYLSCNEAYFISFAVPLLRSIAAVAPGQAVHVHIMDIAAAQIPCVHAFCAALPLDIAVTVEQPGLTKDRGAARNYYHAVRFIRLYQHLQIYRRPLWLMDVDALMNNNPAALFQALAGKDVAFRARPGRLEPWNQFNASIVGMMPTEAGLRYCRLTAAYIAHFHRCRKMSWGIDQLAMYGVFDDLRQRGLAPDLLLLDDHAVDYDYFDDGVLWCNSGRSKFLQIRRKADGTIATEDPDRVKYLVLLDRYIDHPPGNPNPVPDHQSGTSSG